MVPKSRSQLSDPHLHCRELPSLLAMHSCCADVQWSPRFPSHRVSEGAPSQGEGFWKIELAIDQTISFAAH